MKESFLSDLKIIIRHWILFKAFRSPWHGHRFSLLAHQYAELHGNRFSAVKPSLPCGTLLALSFGAFACEIHFAEVFLGHLIFQFSCSLGTHSGNKCVGLCFLFWFPKWPLGWGSSSLNPLIELVSEAGWQQGLVQRAARPTYLSPCQGYNHDHCVFDHWTEPLVIRSAVTLSSCFCPSRLQSPSSQTQSSSLVGLAVLSPREKNKRSWLHKDRKSVPANTLKVTPENGNVSCTTGCKQSNFLTY